MTKRLLSAKAAPKTSKLRGASTAPALAALPAPETTKKRSRWGPWPIVEADPKCYISAWVSLGGQILLASYF